MGWLESYISAFQPIYEEKVIFHKFQCLERPMAPQKRPSYDCLCFEFGKIAAAAVAVGGGKL